MSLYCNSLYNATCLEQEVSSSFFPLVRWVVGVALVGMVVQVSLSAGARIPTVITFVLSMVRVALI